MAGTFQSTRPMRGATRTDTGQRACTRVSIHAPHAGRDPRPPQGRYHKEVSIHAPHAGRDFGIFPVNVHPRTFQSTRPMRGATNGDLTHVETEEFQSTRPMRGATQSFCLMYPPPLFQSTRPMRGATGALCTLKRRFAVSIHAPHAGRDGVGRGRRYSCRVSIHAPHAGRDVTERLERLKEQGFNPRAPCGARRVPMNSGSCRMQFQSTRPMRGATGVGRGRRYSCRVSIHAPHAGRDWLVCHWSRRTASFNPRAPCGARLGSFPAPPIALSFQSTRPMRGATAACSPLPSAILFQSTRPMRGATKHLRHPWRVMRSFNPRAPCGARPLALVRISADTRFNPRAPCGARRENANRRQAQEGFNPRAPCGARRRSLDSVAGAKSFNPRAPCGARLMVRGRPPPCFPFQSTRPMRGATDC